MFVKMFHFSSHQEVSSVLKTNRGESYVTLNTECRYLCTLHVSKLDDLVAY